MKCVVTRFDVLKEIDKIERGFEKRRSLGGGETSEILRDGTVLRTGKERPEVRGEEVPEQGSWR